VLRSEEGQGGVAVLCSGGLDSVVLLADAVRREPPHLVQPLYVSVGLAWEHEELAMLDRVLATAPFNGIRAIARMHVDMRDVYPSTHWAIRGEPPAFDTPDEDVYLDGRNVVLLTKAAVFMARAKLTRLLIGPLAGNPFPDATPEFFDAMGRALSLGLAAPLEIAAPFSTLHKSDVIALGHALGVPLELTLSCMRPSAGRHCGRCSKCRERRDGFREAGIQDPSQYVEVPAR
jgi:7-cyano-7-deazaguanine synthase